MKIHILIAALLGSSLLSAEIMVRQLAPANQVLTVLGGGWDHNANGRPELLILHQPTDTETASEVGYYEMTDDGAMMALWRHRLQIETPARIVDAGLADLDGDQRPEMAVLLYFNTLEDESAPYWLRVFSWDTTTTTFTTEPTARWNYRGQGISYLRARQLVVADMNNDGDDELVIVIGTPDRMLLIADWQPDGFRVYQELRPRQLILGPWRLSVAVADFNGDLRKDILLVNWDSPPAMAAYLNNPTGFQLTNVSTSGGAAINPSAIAVGDLSSNGQEEVLLLRKDGSLTLVGLAGANLTATALQTRVANLVDVATANLDEDTASEIVYLQAGGTITTTDTRFIAPVNREMILASLPGGAAQSFQCNSFSMLMTSPESPPLVAISIHTASGAFVALAEMEESLPDQLSLLPSAVGEPVPVVEAEEEPEVSRPLTPTSLDPRALPSGQTPDILLYVGDEFARNVLGDRGDQFAGFRFLRRPPGMVFNFQRQSIVWQPQQEHLGSWVVDYEVTYTIGVRPGAMVTDSVLVPETETVRGQALVYVNDRPRITSEPRPLQILAGQVFNYNVQTEDNNSDARIEYQLESGPEGMTIDPDGVVSWRTNENHHDDYEVVLLVSDGFDRDTQSFTLNVNARLTIISTVPHVAHVEQPYRYQLEVFQPGSRRQHEFSLLQAPEGMSINSLGLISWTPNTAQIDTQFFRVRVTDGNAEDVQSGWIYANAQPQLVTVPLQAVVVPVGDTLRMAFKGTDSNRDQTLQWSLTAGPVNMTIDSVGTLTWPTSYEDLDAVPYVVELSDGIDLAQFRGAVFVNSPLSITSLPPDSAVVGQTYTYQITTRDNNRGTLLKFIRPTIVTDVAASIAYSVDIQDDQFRQELPRYLAQFREAQNIYINKPLRPAEGETAEAARIDLKQHVKHLFVEGDQLIVVLTRPEQGLIELEDVVWELFQGGRGIMPKYEAVRVPFINYNLREFPDGMTVDNDGLVTWTPTFIQAGYHEVRLTVSDGYSRNDQSFQVYANYPPVIISQADTMALAEQRYVYQVRVDDKNEDAELSYRLTKSPAGMNVDSRGMITWIPSLEQLNWQEFEVEVSDAHAVDRQATTLFVNIPPRVISQPNPVALNNYEYTYRLVAEDLNRDEILYEATKLPRYSDFDSRTGLFRWRPHDIQKGANDVIFEITDSHGAVTVHEFQIHVFEDPSRRRFLFTGWPLLLAFAGIIFVLGVTVG